MGFSDRGFGRKIDSASYGSQMTVFELASASARTWIVAASGLLAIFTVALRQQTHDGCWRLARVEQFGHHLHVRIDRFEKMLVTRAKIVQSRLALWRLDESVFRAFTIASEADLALAAKVRQRVEFLAAEMSLPRRICHRAQALV